MHTLIHSINQKVCYCGTVHDLQYSTLNDLDDLDYNDMDDITLWMI